MVKMRLFLQKLLFVLFLDCITGGVWLHCEMPGLGCLHFAANMAESGGRMSKRLRSEISRSCFNKTAEYIVGFLLSMQAAAKEKISSLKWCNCS